MVNIDKYISELISHLKDKFESRLLYVGLQGSYLRCEATETSDIDIMVIIDELSVSDLKAYRSIIENMEHFEKSCGFICSKDDLLNKSLTDLKDLNDDFTLAEVVPDVDYNVAYNDEAKKIQGGDELSEDELHAKFQNIKSNNVLRLIRTHCCYKIQGKKGNTARYNTSLLR